MSKVKVRCPHCGTEVFVKVKLGSVSLAPNRPMDYIQNPDNKGKVDFQIIKEKDLPEGGSLMPPFMRP